MKYFEELSRAMEMLSKEEKAIFIGQAVACPGTAMTTTLKNVPREKLVELPVAEDMQMGMSIGLALDGHLPISIFPRWNFLLLAVNQLVNHLDKLSVISDGGYKPKVIIRTGIGSVRPMHPQYQHVGDYTEAIQLMCPNVEVIRLEEPEDILPAYKKAMERVDSKSTILVEYGDYYNEK